MLKIENVVLPSAEQWERIIMGTRNPKNSWELSDSYSCEECYQKGDDNLGEKCKTCDGEYQIGKNDHKLLSSLAKGGPVHAKYRRMINVYLDITAPLYWWKEFDVYKIGTVANSCSTMHKIHDKEFTLDDFSCEDLGILIPAELNDGDEVYLNLWEERFKDIVDLLNNARNHFNRETNPELKKKFWRVMIQYLPTSYNQKRTIMLNYEVLVGMYRDRKNHKLDEWHVFCDWIESLPYSELIIGEKKASNVSKEPTVQICKICNGSGDIKFTNPVTGRTGYDTCPTCGGTGIVIMRGIENEED